MSFDSIDTVSGQLSKAFSNATATPKPPSSPLLHVSVSMSPAVYAALQIIQFTSMSSASVQQKDKPLGQKHRQNDKRNIPLLTVYAKGMQCSGLVYHDHNHITTEEATCKHTVFKMSSIVEIPILQAALFAIVDSPQKKPVTPVTDPHSLICFNLSFPSCEPGRSFQAVHILELGLRDSSLSLTAKVQQSELCSNTVLTWTDIHNHYYTPNTSLTQSQSETF